MFLGQYEHNIDEKGRITIPAEFREELGDCVVITQGYDGNLQALPLALYELLAERIRGISILDPDSRRLRRIFFSYAKKIEFDKAGRVLLPAFPARYCKSQRKRHSGGQWGVFRALVTRKLASSADVAE